MELFYLCVALCYDQIVSNMMKFKNTIISATLCGLAFAVFSCTQSGDKIGYSNLNPNAQGIEFADFNVVKLSDDVLLGNIYRINVADDLIFVADSEDRLFSFNMDGSLHAQYGLKGRAGSEYMYLSAFYIDQEADQVCIIDNTQGKLLYFEYDGKFVKADKSEAFNQKTMCYDVYPMPDGKWFVHNRIYNDSNVLFLTVDQADGDIQTVRSVLFETPNIADMCGEHLLSVYDGNISYIAPFDPVIYSYESGKETKRMEIQGITKTLSDKDQSNIKDYDFFKSYNLYNDGYFVGFTGMYETGSFILFNELTSGNYYIIDKNTGIQKRYEYSCDEELKNLPIMGIKAVYKDWFVGIQSATLLLGYYAENMPKKSSDPFISKLDNTIKELKEESNPCILFYKIKTIE